MEMMGFYTAVNNKLYIYEILKENVFDVIKDLVSKKTNNNIIDK